MLYTLSSSLAAQAFAPLWTVGITACAMGFARRERVDRSRLLCGVKRWPVLLRLYLCRGAVYFAAAYAVLMLIMPAYLMTPWGQALYAVLEDAMGTSMTLELTPQLQAQLLQHMGPLYAVWLPVMGAVGLFLRYLFHLALYRVLDEDRPGALRAMVDSCRLLHRHRLQLVKLDLHYWWYYLAQGLLSGILWVPELLTALEVPVPVTGDTAYLLSYLVYAIATAALYLPCLAKVETAYAVFYDTLLHLPRPVRTRPAPTPPPPRTNNDPNLPWR